MTGRLQSEAGPPSHAEPQEGSRREMQRQRLGEQEEAVLRFHEEEHLPDQLH